MYTDGNKLIFSTTLVAMKRPGEGGNLIKETVIYLYNIF